MSLECELGLRKPVVLLGHKALLNLYYTASRLRKKAGEFFQPLGMTDVQFNLMMLLKHQSGLEGGLSQARISKMMLVNRANITTLIDRMEKAGLVARTSEPSDRRFNIIKLTIRGKKQLNRVEPLYIKEVIKTMAALKEKEQKIMITMLEKIRNNVS
jgi:DNA-binding MarR family transcriptional regulator